MLALYFVVSIDAHHMRSVQVLPAGLNDTVDGADVVLIVLLSRSAMSRFTGAIRKRAYVLL
jgi:hypothetical protein